MGSSIIMAVMEESLRSANFSLRASGVGFVEESGSTTGLVPDRPTTYIQKAITKSSIMVKSSWN